MNVNRLCGSGLQAIVAGAGEPLMTDATVVVAGGNKARAVDRSWTTALGWDGAWAPANFSMAHFPSSGTHSAAIPWVRRPRKSPSATRSRATIKTSLPARAKPNGAARAGLPAEGKPRHPRDRLPLPLGDPARGLRADADPRRVHARPASQGARAAARSAWARSRRTVRRWALRHQLLISGITSEPNISITGSGWALRIQT
jgi:hypothetical protein